MEYETLFRAIGSPLDSFNLARAIAGASPNRASGELRDNEAFAQRDPFTFGNTLDSRLFASLSHLTGHPHDYLVQVETNLLIPSEEAANIPQIIRQGYGEFHSVDFVVGEQDSFGRIPVHAAITKVMFGWLTQMPEIYRGNPLQKGYIG